MPIVTDQSDSKGARVRIALKAVPGASRSGIAGVLGDRLKVRVAEPPEGGRANDAICTLIAEVLGVPGRAVKVVVGQGRAEKVVEVTGMPMAEVMTRLGLSTSKR
ncbi:MAG: DUF167 domain-containing protein [Phycisphaerales bacterium]